MNSSRYPFCPGVIPPGASVFSGWYATNVSGWMGARGDCGTRRGAAASVDRVDGSGGPEGSETAEAAEATESTEGTGAAEATEGWEGAAGAPPPSAATCCAIS